MINKRMKEGEMKVYRGMWIKKNKKQKDVNDKNGHTPVVEAIDLFLL